jgi:hypothetical protein
MVIENHKNMDPLKTKCGVLELNHRPL